LPLQDLDIKKLAKQANFPRYSDVAFAFAEIGNRMSTARRCNLAKFFLTLQSRQQNLEPLVMSNPEGVQILIQVSDSLLFH